MTLFIEAGAARATRTPLRTNPKGPYSGWYWEATGLSTMVHRYGYRRRGVQHTACGQFLGRRVPRKYIQRVSACPTCAMADFT